MSVCAHTKVFCESLLPMCFISPFEGLPQHVITFLTVSSGFVVWVSMYHIRMCAVKQNLHLVIY